MVVDKGREASGPAAIKSTEVEEGNKPTTKAPTTTGKVRSEQIEPLENDKTTHPSKFISDKKVEARRGCTDEKRKLRDSCQTSGEKGVNSMEIVGGENLSIVREEKGLGPTNVNLIMSPQKNFLPTKVSPQKSEATHNKKKTGMATSLDQNIMEIKKEKQEKGDQKPAEPERKLHGVRAWKRRARTETTTNETTEMEWSRTNKKHDRHEEVEEQGTKRQCLQYYDNAGGISTEAVVQPRRTP